MFARLVKLIVSFVLALIFTAQISAQEAQQYAFTRYNISNGLASNFVNNLVQDQKGFIWLATINGLQRYDGHKFFAWKHEANNPNSLPADNITKVFLDRDNRLWVATTDNKVGMFNTENFRYQEVPIRWSTSVRINIPKVFFETKDGKLMLFMGHEGLYMLDNQANIFVPAEHVIPAPRGWKRNDIKEDRFRNRFWMACDSGLAVYNPVNGHLSYRGHNVGGDPIIQRFARERFPFGLNVSDSNLFIFGKWDPAEGNPTLNFFDKRNGVLNVYDMSRELKIGYHEIVGNLRQQNGRMWFYGLPFITEYTGQEKPFKLIRNEYRDEQSIKFDRANSMYEDREKNLWISTDNGVYLFNPDAQVFNSYSLLRPGDVDPVEVPTQCLLNLDNGQIWIGSWGGGLYCYNRDFTPIDAPASLRDMRENCSIWSMWKHQPTGMIWIGLQSGVLVVYDPSTGKAKKLTPAIFQGRTIRQITGDKLGNLWFGSQGGHIVKWDPLLARDKLENGFVLV
ncbi:MAG TPA: two-component regulator propeller domain-containing protein, partial [Chitinophagaceae bacterium]|nr:two-component regulator propeller domain-containing protein [Chitinophagaceae bacterium]